MEQTLTYQSAPVRVWFSAGFQRYVAGETAAIGGTRTLTAYDQSGADCILSLGGGLYDPARFLGAPIALKDFGVSQSDLARVADLAVKNPYANPREVTRDGVLLRDAWAGTRIT